MFFPRLSYKWNHVVCDLLCQVSCLQHNVWDSSMLIYIYIYQEIVPFSVKQYSILWIYHNVFTNLLMNVWVISSLRPLNVKLFSFLKSSHFNEVCWVCNFYTKLFPLITLRYYSIVIFYQSCLEVWYQFDYCIVYSNLYGCFWFLCNI